jgi:hypothetical protein
MRNEALDKLDVLVGRYRVTVENAWFYDEGTVLHGDATVEWLGESFLWMRYTIVDPEKMPSETNMVFGYSDPAQRYTTLYHDPRGTARVFDTSFDGRELVLSREDPDFHQRLIFTVEPDRLVGHPDASEDEGKTWRKDFDITFTRTRQ